MHVVVRDNTRWVGEGGDESDVVAYYPGVALGADVIHAHTQLTSEPDHESKLSLNTAHRTFYGAIPNCQTVSITVPSGVNLQTKTCTEHVGVLFGELVGDVPLFVKSSCRVVARPQPGDMIISPFGGPLAAMLEKLIKGRLCVCFVTCLNATGSAPLSFTEPCANVLRFTLSGITPTVPSCIDLLAIPEDFIAPTHKVSIAMSNALLIWQEAVKSNKTAWNDRHLFSEMVQHETRRLQLEMNEKNTSVLPPKGRPRCKLLHQVISAVTNHIQQLNITVQKEALYRAVYKTNCTTAPKWWSVTRSAPYTHRAPLESLSENGGLLVVCHLMSIHHAHISAAVLKLASPLSDYLASVQLVSTNSDALTAEVRCPCLDIPSNATGRPCVMLLIDPVAGNGVVSWIEGILDIVREARLQYGGILIIRRHVSHVPTWDNRMKLRYFLEAAKRYENDLSRHINHFIRATADATKHRAFHIDPVVAIASCPKQAAWLRVLFTRMGQVYTDTWIRFGP